MMKNILLIIIKTIKILKILITKILSKLALKIKNSALFQQINKNQNLKIMEYVLIQ